MRRRCRRAPVLRSSFAGFRFPPDVITLAVRWYLRYGLSYRDVEELLSERGVVVNHVTIYCWVQRFTPLAIDAAQPCRHATGDCWFADETYLKSVVNLFDSSSCRITQGHGWGGSAGPRCCVSGGRGQSGNLVPGGESDGHLPAVLLSGEPVTARPEVRGYSAERGEESLRVSG
jgi:hypothetical protein